MLTADLVRATRKKGELRISPLSAPLRARALELATLYTTLFREHVGLTREELEESLDAVEISSKERLLSRGLRKLLEDRSVFDASGEVDPPQLRGALFSRAAERLRALEDGARLDRAAVVAEVAAEAGISTEALERALFADLRSAHALQQFEPIGPEALVASWELGQAQAVLLRAVRVRVEVDAAAPGAYRALFRKLKFLRLLYTLELKRSGGYRIDIDGPFSLFEQVTKYGLELAMLLPALECCPRYRLEAEVRWGADRQPLRFEREGGTRGEDTTADEALPDEVADLVERFSSLDSPWKVRVADELIEVRGHGVLVPDLVFERKDGARVFLEVLGHWSRSAVWKRVEAVEAGEVAPLVFAVSARLRVSEEALDDEVPAALYVYKGTMSAKAVLEKLEAVAARGGAAPRSRLRAAEPEAAPARAPKRARAKAGDEAEDPPPKSTRARAKRAKAEGADG